MNKIDLQKWTYCLILFFMTLSGFAQMPIFKRYYIADIPGLGWLAEFYITHLIHYAAASILIGFAFYYLADFILKGKRAEMITRTGRFGFTVLAGLIISGILMVVKNLDAVFFPHPMVIALNLVHLSLCILILGLSGYTVWQKKKWVAS
ncbi:MAG: hypothetical protein MI862_10460 [Desulfobacterales bacterium]|nr:hypothetical protein [Desulfobacterales bacterium]